MKKIVIELDDVLVKNFKILCMERDETVAKAVKDLIIASLKKHKGIDYDRDIVQEPPVLSHKKILMQERREKIRLAIDNGRISLDEIAAQVGCTPMTVFRDLRYIRAQDSIEDIKLFREQRETVKEKPFDINSPIQSQEESW